MNDEPGRCAPRHRATRQRYPSAALVVAIAAGFPRAGSYQLVYAGELLRIALVFAGFGFVGKAEAGRRELTNKFFGEDSDDLLDALEAFRSRQGDIARSLRELAAPSRVAAARQPLFRLQTHLETQPEGLFALEELEADLAAGGPQGTDFQFEYARPDVGHGIRGHVGVPRAGTRYRHGPLRGARQGVVKFKAKVLPSACSGSGLRRGNRGLPAALWTRLGTEPL